MSKNPHWWSVTRRNPSRIARVLAPMNIDYAKLSGALDSGELRSRLKCELVTGFMLMIEAGDPVPPASYFATKISEIIYASRDREIESNTQYDLYQEVLLACEEARMEVLGDDPDVN